MVRQCYLCKVYNYQEEGHNLSFHSFPVDPVQKGIWASLLGFETDHNIPKRAEICSKHFHPNDFECGLSGKRSLRKGAVPLARHSVFDSPGKLSSESTISEVSIVSATQLLEDIETTGTSTAEPSDHGIPAVKRCSVEDIQSSSNTGNGSKILRRALNVSSLEPASQRSSTKYVNSHPSLIRSGNQQQISNESGEKVTIQNVPVSCDDRLIRKAYGAKRVRFDIPTNKENVASSKQQTTTTSTSESNFNISTTDATRVQFNIPTNKENVASSKQQTITASSSHSNFNVSTTAASSVKVIPITPDQIQNLSKTPGVKLIPVTPNQAKNMSTPGVLIAVPSGSSEAPIQILTPNSSAVISKVVISQLQPETTDVKNIGSLSPHSSSTRATSNHISKFQYILPKPPSPTARMPDPVDEEIDIKVEDLEPVETLEIKSELDSEPDIASDKETDTSETLTASDTSETLTASETEEICAAMDKRALRYGDVDRSNETETWSGGTNYKPRCKKVRFFGDLKLEDLRRNYNRATDSWNIIQKTVQKHRELIDELSEENEELTKEINKINNALRLLKEEGYVTSDNQLIMSSPWDAVVEEPKIIEPSPSGSSNSVAKKLSFWRIEKQD